MKSAFSGILVSLNSKLALLNKFLNDFDLMWLKIGTYNCIDIFWKMGKNVKNRIIITNHRLIIGCQMLCLEKT